MLKYIVCFLLCPIVAFGQAREYEVVPEASSFEFEIEHFGVATVNGLFSEASGSIQYDSLHPDSISATISIDVNSVDTGNRLRDKELRSEDFLDVRRYPRITFVSSGSGDVEGNEEKRIIYGRMTVYGTTRETEIPFDARLDSSTQELTIHSTFELNRADYKLDFGLLMNSMIGDVIRVTVTMTARES